MAGVHVEKYELIQMMVDSIADEFGEKAVDNVDLEALASKCIKQMHFNIETMLNAAILQAGGKKVQRAYL